MTDLTTTPWLDEMNRELLRLGYGPDDDVTGTVLVASLRPAAAALLLAARAADTADRAVARLDDPASATLPEMQALILASNAATAAHAEVARAAGVLFKECSGDG